MATISDQPKTPPAEPEWLNGIRMKMRDEVMFGPLEPNDYKIVEYIDALKAEIARLNEVMRLSGIAANPEQILCPHCGADWKLK